MWLLLMTAVSGSCGGSSPATAVGASPSAPDRSEASAPADKGAASSALSGRTIVGYQGWFGCPTEVPAGNGTNARWRHWFDGQTATAEHLTVDMLPDVAALPGTALCTTALRREDGSTVAVFSSADPAVIDIHFRWMATHGIDGAAVQRFVSELHVRADRDRSDAILNAIRTAAQAHGRVFYISYDISGADPATVYDDIRADWEHLTGTLQLTGSPAYLGTQERPILQLWGFGFKDRPGEPDQVLRLMSDLRYGRGAGADVPPPPTGSALPDEAAAVSLIGGVPSGWRNANGDSKAGAGWAAVYRSFDAISPWAVGRYDDEASNRGFVDGMIGADLMETGRLGIGYMPVIFPGFSWANLMSVRGNEAAAVQNRIARRCGNFLWQQGQTRIAAGARSLFIAMFDEVDEATAVMPVVTRTGDLPQGTRLIALDHDGCELPSDWYLRVSGSLASYLRSAQVPPASLSAVLRP